jgi:hypothetical protein
MQPVSAPDRELELERLSAAGLSQRYSCPPVPSLSGSWVSRSVDALLLGPHGLNLARQARLGLLADALAGA